MSYLDRAAIARGIKARVLGARLLKSDKRHDLTQAILEPSAPAGPVAGETVRPMERTPVSGRTGETAA